VQNFQILETTSSADEVGHDIRFGPCASAKHGRARLPFTANFISIDQNPPRSPLFSGGAVAQQPNKLWLEVGMEDGIVIHLSFHLGGFSVAVEIDNPASLGIMFYLYAPQINKYQKGSAADSGLSI
jgi:hypothetical protein